jgi:DNA-binding response OmpR family regulator
LKRALIVLVDDDPGILARTASILREGYSVECFSSASSALDALEGIVPDAIVSDIVMPGIGGFELRRLYERRFAARRTPFLFLSSLGDEETIVAGLDAGADDFVIKPPVPELLRARIRAVLRRSTKGARTFFRGELARVPFVSLLQFCEAKALTGELEIEAEGLRVSLPLRAGVVDYRAAEPWLDRLCGLAEGTYALRSAPLDFAELEHADARRPPDSGPSGRISTIRVRDRLLHVETELVHGDAPTIVSLILAGDQPVAKVRRRVPEDAELSELQGLIDAQHEEVEASTHDRVSAARQKLEATPAGASPTGRAASGPPAREAAPEPETSGPSSTDAARSSALFDDGFDRFRRRDFAGALACWELALELNPTSRTLAINVDVARKKLEAAGSS